MIQAAFKIDTPAALNRSYREQARHYGVRIDPTPPRSPEKKGRVENAVRYVKHNFLPTFTAHADAGRSCLRKLLEMGMLSTFRGRAARSA